MGNQDIVGHKVRLGGGVASTSDSLAPAILGWAAPSWSMSSGSISEPGEGVRLVEGNPVFDSVAEVLEAEIRIIDELLDDAGVQPSAVNCVWVVEGLREIPMIKGDVGSDIGGEQGVDESVVESNTFRIGVVNVSLREKS